jgi:hypothetical protein
MNLDKASTTARAKMMNIQCGKTKKNHQDKGKDTLIYNSLISNPHLNPHLNPYPNSQAVRGRGWLCNKSTSCAEALVTRRNIDSEKALVVTKARTMTLKCTMITNKCTETKKKPPRQRQRHPNL